MKIKSILKICQKKFDDWANSIENEELRKLVIENSIITGGSIPSMLLKEEVNDFDIYFRNKQTARAVCDYYVSMFNATAGTALEVDDEPDRIRIVKKTGQRGATEGNVMVITDSGQIEDEYESTQNKALEVDNEEGKPKYRPVFLSTNAITLSSKVQLIIRFFGDPDEIHQNYDFVHCTSYWTSWENKLVLRQEALESIMSKELRYVGSKYPLCSIIRLRKFIARQWTVNAGQILKMIMQCGELDLTDPKVLEDQLTGVDSAYFCEVISKLKEKDPEKINCAYLCEIIDRMF